jgi:hypothetical protein
MQQNNLSQLFLATVVAFDLVRISEQCRSVRESLLEGIDELVLQFLTQPITPQATFDFETTLEDLLREIGRQTMEVVLNQIEADDAQGVPQRVEREGQEYRSKNKKTKNRSGIGTVFGQIMLLRFSYEPLQEGRDDGQKSFSPLELLLGIVVGNATAALAERVGREAAHHTQGEMTDSNFDFNPIIVVVLPRGTGESRGKGAAWARRWPRPPSGPCCSSGLANHWHLLCKHSP